MTTPCYVSANSTATFIGTSDGGLTYETALILSPRARSVTLTARLTGPAVTPQLPTPDAYTFSYSCVGGGDFGCTAGRVVVPVPASPTINESDYHVLVDRGNAAFHWSATGPAGWYLPGNVDRAAEALTPGALVPGLYAFLCNVTDGGASHEVAVVFEVVSTVLNVTNGTAVFAGSDLTVAWTG